MKYRFSNELLFIKILCLFVFCFSISITKPYAENTPEKITVVGENSPPFEYKGANGQAKGIVVDIWKLWAEKAGVKLEYKIMEWSKALAMVQEGKADIVSGMFRTDEREVIWDFTAPFYEIPVSIFFSEEVGGISSLDDLVGFKIGVMKGDASVSMIKNELPDAVLEEYPSWNSLVQAGVDGKILVFVADAPQALYYLSQKHALNKFKRPQKNLKIGKLHGGIRKGNAELINFVNRHLKKINHEDMEKIRHKWQGDLVDAGSSLTSRIIVAGAFLALIIISHILILRSKVSRRTKELEYALHELDAQKEKVENEVRQKNLSERSKRLSEKKYQNVIESCPLGVFNFEMKPGGELILTNANKAASTLVGVDYTKRIGMRLLDAFPGVNEKIREKAKLAAVEGIAVEGEVVHYKDTEIYMYSELQIFQNSPNNITVMSADVTDKIKAEDTLKQSQDFLEKEIRKRTRELLDSNQQLSEEIEERDKLQNQLVHSERLAAVGTLAAGVAHEFNNINTGILGFAEMASREEGLSADLKDFHARIIGSALRAKDITNNLLAYTSQHTGEKEMADINRIVDETIPIVKNEFKSYGINIETKYGDVPNILVSPSQVSQVILNLLINSAHSVLDRDKKNIWVNTGSDYENVWVSVKDNGIGISEDNLKQIFTPFFSTKGEYSRSDDMQSNIKGIGLGLSVSQKIIENHNGELSCSSKEDEGSFFKISLPIIKAERSEFKTPRHIDSSNIVLTAKAVVIDDEVDVRDLLKIYLEKCGCETEIFEDGNKALDFIKEEGPEYAFIDLQMPHLRGELVIGEIARMPEDKRPLCIVITGLNNTEANKAIEGLPIFRAISKPFKLEEITETLLAGREEVRKRT